jgi:hypothetical protein
MGWKCNSLGLGFCFWGIFGVVELLVFVEFNMNTHQYFRILKKNFIKSAQKMGISATFQFY